MITYLKDDSLKTMPKFRHREVTSWINRVAAQYGKRVGDIAYVFCDEDKILDVNRQYLQHDYLTDIITFDDSEDEVIGGDIFISVPTVRSNAEQFGASFTQELHRIIIHGVLHLTGQNDKSETEREEMTRKENRALAMLGMDA